MNYDVVPNKLHMDYYPEDIAKVIEHLADIEIPKNIHEDIVDSIYHLRTCAENTMNRRCFRILYAVLNKIAEENPDIVYAEEK